MELEKLSNSPLRSAVARWLAGLGYWGSEEDILRRMEHDFANYDGGEYSYYLSDDFDQSLIHLPNAIDFIRRQTDDCEIAMRGAVTFVGWYASRLQEEKLLEPVVDQLQQLIRAWSLDFTAPQESPLADGKLVMGLACGETPLLDELWEKLLMAKAVVDGRSLFERLLESWVGDVSTPEGSASVLCFLLRVRFTPDRFLSLHKDPHVLAHAFDNRLLRSHWTSAAPVIRRKCSPELARAIENAVVS